MIDEIRNCDIPEEIKDICRSCENNIFAQNKGCAFRSLGNEYCDYVLDATRLYLKLQSNWNSLKKKLEWEINDYNGNIDIETRNIDSEFLRGIAWEAQELLDKMNELEGIEDE